MSKRWPSQGQRGPGRVLLRMRDKDWSATQNQTLDGKIVNDHCGRIAVVWHIVNQLGFWLGEEKLEKGACRCWEYSLGTREPKVLDK